MTSVYRMVMCGNFMVTGTDAMLKMENPYWLNGPVDLEGLWNKDVCPLLSAASLHVLYHIHMSARVMSLGKQPCKSTGHCKGGKMGH